MLFVVGGIDLFLLFEVFGVGVDWLFGVYYYYGVFGNE